MKPLFLGFLALIAVLLFSTSSVYALSTFSTVQGGTGTSSPSGILYGSGSANALKTVTPGANCTFAAGVFNCTSAGGTGSGTVGTSTALASGQVDFSTGVATIGNDSNFLWDNTLKLFTILTNATTSKFSSYQAWFGGSATSSFSSTGALTLATALTVGNGGTGQTTLGASQLLYGQGTGGVQSVATTSLTATSPLSLSQPVVKVGGSDSIITISTAGTWSGNAGTATALAADGANCSAGNYPLGVDASGAVQNCTAANTGTVTSIATTWPITGGTITSTGTLSWGGLATTSNLTAGQLVMSNGANGLSSIATTTVTCAGTASCTTFAIPGSSPITITGSGSSGTNAVSTSTNETAGNFSYWTTTSGSPAKLGSIASSTVLGSTTAAVWLDSSRTDTYNEDGTYARPFKSISAANTWVTNNLVGVAQSVTYYLEPKSSYNEQTFTWPNIPIVVHANKATIVLLNGGSVGRGTMTFPNDVQAYDLVVFGHTIQSSTSLTNPHSFHNGFFDGNVVLAGNGIIFNSAIVDQNAGAFPTIFASSASSSLQIRAGALTNVLGSNVQTVIDVQGILNLDDSNVQTATSTRYAIIATTTGSQLLLAGVSLQNELTGGGINCQNGTTITAPNHIGLITTVLGAGSTNGIDCGSATTFIDTGYSISTRAGVRLQATGSDKQVPNVEGYLVDTFLAIASSTTSTGATFRWPILVGSSTGPQIALTDNLDTKNIWTLRAINNSLYISTSSPSTFATSTASALSVNANGQLTIAGMPSCSGNSALTTNSSGTIICGAVSGGGSGTGNVATSTSEVSKQVAVFSSNSATPATIAGYTNYVFDSVYNALGIGTSTPRWNVTIASSTGPQLALSDGLNNTPIWTFAAKNGELDIATSSPSTFSTTTISAIRITPGGAIQINAPYQSSAPIPIGGVLDIMSTTTGNSTSGITLRDPGQNTSLRWWIDNNSQGRLDAGITGTGNIVLNGLGGGFVGIGTTTPATVFSINGIANFRLATTSFSSTGGIDMASGCFAIRGTCIGSGGGGSGTVNSGTTNQLAYYTGSTAVSSSAFITESDGANWLGIGTTTPRSLLWLATSTAPQLTLGAGNNTPAFNFRTVNGNFYISTSSPTGTFATSTLSIFSILGATGASNATTSINGADLSITQGSQTAFSINDIFGTNVVQVNTASTTGNIFQVQATTSAASILFGVDQYGHMTASSTGATPTVSTCGTSPSMAANANDVTGTVNVGSVTATACTITFAHAYSNTPTVVISDDSTAITGDVSAVSTTAFTVSFSASLAGGHIYYMVMQP